MKKLIGQLIVSPLLAVLILTVCFGDWWDSVGMRPRWSVWILLSAGLLLLSHYLWTALERRLPARPAPPHPAPKKLKLSSAVAPAQRTTHAAPPPANPLSFEQEQHLMDAARRILAGDSFRVELYRDQGKLIIHEMRLSRDRR